MKKSFIPLVIVLYCLNLIAQNSILNYSGNVAEKNGETITGELRFISDKDVKRTRVNKNKYTMGLLAGKTYKVYMPNYIFDGNSQEVIVPNSGYQEIEKNLSCRKLQINETIFSESIFAPNTASKNSGIESKMRTLKDFLESQPNIGCNLVISANDCSFKAIKKTETITEGKKKKKVTKETTVKEQAKQMIEQRKTAMEEILKSVNLRLGSFNIVEEEYSPKGTKSSETKDKKKSKDKNTKQSSSGFANVRITILKIKN